MYGTVARVLAPVLFRPLELFRTYAGEVGYFHVCTYLNKFVRGSVEEDWVNLRP